MLNNTFYYNTIRKVIVAFGTLFSDININRTDREGNVRATLGVPITYTPKEKFISRINSYSSIDDDETRMQTTLPRMGFTMDGVQYASERKTNTMRRIVNRDSSDHTFMYNRVPYNVTFTLYIATRKFDDSLRIVEQILPYFTPEFNVQIVDKEDFDISTNVPYILDAVDLDMNSTGDFKDRRTIMWTLQFTAKIYLYAATTQVGLIKKAIIDVADLDSGHFYEEYMATVDPMSAGKDDPHSIIETIREVNNESETILSASGQQMDVLLT